MAKKILDELKGKHYKIDFKYDDEENQLRKKIKLENEMIVEKLIDIKDDIDISENGVQKFLLIFHSLMEIVNSEEIQEETDSIITDAIPQIVLKISDLLKKNVDSLNLPALLKNALKKIKSFLNIKTEAENNAEKTSETTRDGGKEQ